jgi:nicotinamidase
MVKVALLLIDIQHDFLPEGPLAVKDGDKIIEGAVLLLKNYKWDTVIFSQDWHPKDHTSFASNHEKVKPFESIEFVSTKDPSHKEFHTVWPNHCIQHTQGANFPQKLIDAFKDVHGVAKTIIQKGQLQDRDYYSAFNDVWDDDQTELNDFLKENDIDTVVLAGLAYDYCVKFSSASAAKLGYKTYVIKSLSKAIETDKIDEIDAYYRNAGVTILNDVDELTFVPKIEK